MAVRNQENAGALAERKAAQQINELGKAYEQSNILAKKLRDTTLALTNDEEELVSLSKSLELTLQNIIASKVLQNNENRTTKQITQELKNLENSRILHLKERDNLQNALNSSINDERNKEQNHIYKINRLNNDLFDAQVKQQTSLDRIIDLRYNKSVAQNAKLQLDANDRLGHARAANKIAQIQLDLTNELQDQISYKQNIKFLEKEISKEEQLLDIAQEKIFTAEEAYKINDNLLDQLDEQISALKKIKADTSQKSAENIKSFFRNKFTTLIALLGLKDLVNVLFEADKQVTDFASNLGISRDLGQDIRSNWMKYVQTIKDGSISLTDMINAQENLSKELGISVLFANKELETFNKLTKLMGVSNKSASNLLKFSKFTNTEYDLYIKSAIKGAAFAQKSLSIQVATKDILEDIGNLSAGILVKFQGNPEALGKAVIQAQKLGLSLEQIDKIGESLLNWESSIENELRAELLTGRELNLERARAAALVGDQVTLMNELSSQVGSQEDFIKLNVLAQKSLAESFGLSRDEMSDMLLKQEMIAKYGDQAAKLNTIQLQEAKNQNLSIEEYLIKQQAQLSLQEKFNNSIDKFKQVIISVVDGPFGILVNGLIKVLSNSKAIYGIMVLIGGVMGGMMVKGIYSLISGLGVLVGELAAAATLASFTASALTLGGAAIGIIAAGYAINKSMKDAIESNNKFQSIKDGIAPASKGPFTITDNYGATAITTTGDGLAVSPNINKSNTSSYDYKRLEDKLEKLINISQQQYEVQKQGTTLQINEFALGKVSPLATAKENPRNFL